MSMVGKKRKATSYRYDAPAGTSTFAITVDVAEPALQVLARLEEGETTCTNGIAAQDIVARHASTATAQASERFIVISTASDAIKRWGGGVPGALRHVRPPRGLASPPRYCHPGTGHCPAYGG